MDEPALRRAIVEAARAMNALGINQGSSGNISARCGGRMLITPSATPYAAMQPSDVAAMALDDPDAGGDDPEISWHGPLPPSSEWRFHRAILRGRPEAGAVVHTHAPHCTALAILRRGIPAVHYMVAAFGGSDIRCAPYATFGTAELAGLALAALEDRHACLLANHGMIAIGATLAKAMWRAVELEALARQYCVSLQLGTPCVLTESEMAEAMARFATYGLPDSPARGQAADASGATPRRVAPSTRTKRERSTMSDAKRPPTSGEAPTGAGERERARLDAGETGDKVGHGDPAASPLGTDDEAGGGSHDEDGLAVARRASDPARAKAPK